MTEHASAINHIKERFQAQLESLKQELDEGLAKIPVASKAISQGSGLKEALTIADTFSKTFSQVELLTNLLALGAAYVPRIALFILKEKHVHGWEAKGFSAEFCAQKIKKVHWNISEYAELAETVAQRASLTRNFSDLSDLSEAIKGFDGYVPFMTCFHPVVVRNKVAAVIYADSGAESTMGHPDMLKLLAYIAGLELTMITTRLKKPFEFKKQDPRTPPLAQPKPAESSATPRQAIPPQVKPQPVPEPEPPTPELEHPAPEPEPEVTAPAPTPASHPQPRDRTQEKNRRVARVLVSDIKLYHEAAVAQGQKEGNMYVLLKEDIDRSYQHYQQKTKGKLPEGDNYFKEELIRQLTDGHPELLGDLPF